MGMERGILRQLQSSNPKAVAEALVVVARARTYDSTTCRLIAEIANSSTPPWKEELTNAIRVFPCAEFSPYLIEMLSWCEVDDLQFVSEWKGVLSGMEVRQLNNRLENGLESRICWERFISAVELSRLSEVNNNVHWWHAISAINDADTMDWWKSIRSEAEEYLTSEETDKINLWLVINDLRLLSYDRR